MCFQLKPAGVGTRLGSGRAGGAGEVLGAWAAVRAPAADCRRTPRAERAGTAPKENLASIYRVSSGQG